MAMNDTLQPMHLSAPAEAARLRALGFNIIPVHPGTKILKGGPDDITKYHYDGCDAEISETDSIAMLHGDVGGTWALNLDDPTILADLLERYEGDVSRMCMVKTPKRGHHILFKRDESDPPPNNYTYEDVDERRIGISPFGYTLLPPSVHVYKNLGRYEYTSGVDRPLVVMKWRDAVHLTQGAGFTRVQQRTSTHA